MRRLSRRKLFGCTLFAVAVGLIPPNVRNDVRTVSYAGDTAACGVMNIEPNANPDLTLEKLALAERYVDAIAHAVAVVRERSDRLGPMHPDTLLSLHRLGVVAKLAGDPRTAQTIFDAVLAARERVLSARDPSIAETLLRRGQLFRYRFELDRAAADYDRAATIVRANPQARLLAAHLQHMRADWTWRNGDRPGSLLLYRKALEMRRSALHSPSYCIADNVVWLAWSLEHSGQQDDARKYFHDAEAELRALDLSRHTLSGVVSHALGELSALEGKWDEAEPYYRATSRLFQSARAGYPPGYSRIACPLDGFEDWAAAVLRDGRPEEAWRLVETARAPLHAEFLEIGAWKTREPATFPAFDDLRRRLLTALRAVDDESSRGTETWSASTFRLLLRAVELKSELYEREAKYLKRHPPPQPSLERTRALLDEKTALLGWTEIFLNDRVDPWIGERLVYVLRKHGPITWIRLPSVNSATCQTWDPILRATRWRLSVAEDAEALEGLRAWTARSFDPMLPFLEGVNRIVVSGMTRPIQVQSSASGFLGDQFLTYHVPSAVVASMLAEETSQAQIPGRRKILTVSGPTYASANGAVEELIPSPTETAGTRELRSTFLRDQLAAGTPQALRFAGREATMIAERFANSTVLSGIPDVVQRIHDFAERRQLAGFDVIHLASHTVLDAFPERCALLLGDTGHHRNPDDGLVDAEEIFYDWDLDASLVVISGCHSARGVVSSRQEHAGLTPALFAAGARSLVTSLWPLDDRATTVLMDRFYRDLTESPPMEPGAALQEAQRYVRELKSADGSRPFAHPAYWGGFIFLGMPAPRRLPEDPPGSSLN